MSLIKRNLHIRVCGMKKGRYYIVAPQNREIRTVAIPNLDTECTEMYDIMNMQQVLYEYGITDILFIFRVVSLIFNSVSIF